MINHFCVLVGLVCVLIGIVRSDHLAKNDRVSGTPRLELNEENLTQLALRTSHLHTPFLHKPQKSYTLGDMAQFYIYNFVDEKYIQESATLRFTDGFINIWVSDAEWSNGHVTSQVIQQVYQGLMVQTPAASIDKNKGIVEIIHSNFGLPPNFDGDGVTDFLLTDIQDGWEEGEGFIAGYFNPLDQFINGTFVGRTQISGSNERDILYIDTYPGIYRDGSFGYSEVLGTVSHEYQHLIHYRYDKNELPFINEGLSELSSFLCGYGLRDPSKYLINTNISLTAWDSELPQALAHYAKTALWTFYLYENFGPLFIRELAQSAAAGIAGVEAALNSSGYETLFSAVLERFFLTITLNGDVNGSDYQFKWPPLSGLRAVPQVYIRDYPYVASIKNPAYALALYRFENGDTLSVATGNPPENLIFLVNKYAADGRATYLMELPLPDYDDNDFGNLWQIEDLLVINNGANAAWSLSASSRQRYYTSGYLLSDEALDLRIQISDEIIANSISVPFDSCRLRSVRFYNQQSIGGVQIHIYNERIVNRSVPQGQSILFENVLQGDWIELDLQGLEIWRKAGETFDIGIELLNGGIIGYTGTAIDQVNSFLYRPSQNMFLELENFKVESGALSGTWLLDVSYTAPIRYKPGSNHQIPASFRIESIGPLPFPSPSNPELYIQYTLNKPGHLNVSIYNVLGQRIRSLADSYQENLAGTLSWSGDNDQGVPVASGNYYLNFKFEDQVDTRKILIVR